jgi:hypothetical protein
MGDEKDKDKGSETLPVEQLASPANESISATFDDLKKLDSSILAQMQSLLAGFLAPKENPIPSAGASPKDASAQNPLIAFVPEKGKPLDENLEGTDTSTSKENDNPKEKKGNP